MRAQSESTDRMLPGSASTKTSSRRALLAGALGGIGAVAAGAMASVSPVRAEGEAIVVGGEYTTATSRTYLESSGSLTTVLEAASTAYGTAIRGSSVYGIGVYGTSDIGYAVQGVSTSNNGVRGVSTTSIGVSGVSSSDIGVHGQSDTGMGALVTTSSVDQPAVLARSYANQTGLYAYSGLTGTIPPAQPKTGVYGYADHDWLSRGVWGYSGQGQGVRGATAKGVGVYGKANKNGYAFRAYGRIKADKVSGTANIPAGLITVTLTPGVKVTNDSFVLLTPRANLGGRDLWYTTTPSADTITIHLSSSRPSATKIGWLLMG